MGGVAEETDPLETCHWRMTNYQPDVLCLKQSDTPDAIIAVCHSGGDTLLRNVTYTVQSSYGYLVSLPRRKKTKQPKVRPCHVCSCFFPLIFLQRFTAWVKIINIWPTEQLATDENLCLHPTQLGFQQKGGALDTQKCILNTGALFLG